MFGGAGGILHAARLEPHPPARKPRSQPFAREGRLR
jgi:hypothetical protein